MDFDTSSSTLDLFEMHEHGDSCRPLAVLFECMYDYCLRTRCGTRYLDAFPPFCSLRWEINATLATSTNVTTCGAARRHRVPLPHLGQPTWPILTARRTTNLAARRYDSSPWASSTSSRDPQRRGLRCSHLIAGRVDVF